MITYSDSQPDLGPGLARRYNATCSCPGNYGTPTNCENCENGYYGSACQHACPGIQSTGKSDVDVTGEVGGGDAGKSESESGSESESE